MITNETHEEFQDILIRSGHPVAIVGQMLRREGYKVDVRPTKVATNIKAIEESADQGDIHILESPGPGRIPAGAIIEVKQLMAQKRIKGVDWHDLESWQFTGKTKNCKKVKRYMIDSVRNLNRKIVENRKPYGYIGVNAEMTAWAWIPMDLAWPNISVDDGFCQIRKKTNDTYFVPADLVEFKPLY